MGRRKTPTEQLLKQERYITTLPTQCPEDSFNYFVYDWIWTSIIKILIILFMTNYAQA